MSTRLRPTVAALALLLLGLAARVWDLSGPSLWYDEGYTVMLASSSPAELFRLAAERELNTPLHYLALQVWTAGAGDSEFAGRFLSVACGVLTIACALRLRLGGRSRAALTAALLVALSPVCIATSRELRMYALAAFLAFASVVCVSDALSEGRRARWLLWAALCATAFASHVLTVFVFAGEVAALCVLRLRRDGAGRPPNLAFGLAALVGAVSIAWTAWILSYAPAYGVNYSSRLPLLETLLQSASAVVWNGPAVALSMAFGLGLCFMIGAALVATLVRRGKAAAADVPLLGITALAALTGIAVFCALTGKFALRYPAITAPEVLTAAPFAVLGLMRAAAGTRAKDLAAAALASAACGVWIVSAALSPAKPNEDYRAAAAFLKSRVQPDETVLLVSGHQYPAFEYYYGPEGWRALPDDPVLVVANALGYDSAVPLLNDALRGKSGAWLVLWQDGVSDPTALVEQLLRRQSPAFTTAEAHGTFAGLRLLRYRFNTPYEALPATLPRSGSEIRDRGARLGLGSDGCGQLRETRAGDGFLELVCLWRRAAESDLPWDTKVSLRLRDATGRQLVQLDQNLADRGLPSQPYPRPIVAIYELPIPEDLAAGRYTLDAIPYSGAGEVSPQVSTGVDILPR